jgi:ribosomal protein L35AE/L33A
MTLLTIAQLPARVRRLQISTHDVPLTIRRKRNTNPGTSLLKLEGVDDTAAAQWYAGKRVAVREQTTHGWYSGD